MARRYRWTHETQYNSVSSFRIIHIIQLDKDIGVYGNCNHNFAITID
jgi:hypothetical protein